MSSGKFGCFVSHKCLDHSFRLIFRVIWPIKKRPKAITITLFRRHNWPLFQRGSTFEDTHIYPHWNWMSCHSVGCEVDGGIDCFPILSASHRAFEAISPSKNFLTEGTVGGNYTIGEMCVDVVLLYAHANTACDRAELWNRKRVLYIHKTSSIVYQWIHNASMPSRAVM